MIGAGLFVGTVLLFLRALPYGFINYDDPIYVTNNVHVRAGLTWEGVVWAFTGRADYWHPLTWLSHMVDWSWHGEWAMGHRLTSVCWHALNAVLAWRVLVRLTGSTGFAALAAAAFAWHPLRVESVVWITERKDVMSGAFFLLLLLAYGRYEARREAGRPVAGAYGVTLGLFLAGLACKPVLVTAPLVLLAWDFGTRRRSGRGADVGWVRARVVEKVPFLVLSAVIAGVTIVMQRQAQAFSLDVPLEARLGNAVVSVVRYVGKTVWPFDLAICYPHPGYWPVAVVAGAVSALAGAGWWLWRRRASPWPMMGAIWFVAMLLPTLGLLQVGVQAMADRYSYLPSLGLLLMGSGLAARWSAGRWRRTAVVAAVLVLAALAVRTWDQQAVWRDSGTLFAHAAAVTKDNSFALGYLAHTRMTEGRWAEAEAHAAETLALNARSETALFVLAGVRERQGRVDEAIALYQRILVERPDDAQTAMLLGGLLAGRGRLTDAEPHLRAAVRAEDVYADAALRLALASRDAGQGAAAALYFNVYCEVRPDEVEPRMAWAEVLARSRQFAAALAQYETAAALQPGNAEAQAGAGYMLWLTGRREEAVERWREALRLKPDFPGLRERLPASDR